MSFVHVFGVNVDISFIVFVIMAICGLAIGIRVAITKNKYTEDVDNENDPIFFLDSGDDYKCTLTDSHYACLEGNVFYTEDIPEHH